MRVQHQTNFSDRELKAENLPPITFESPEKIFVRLDTTMSAESRTAILMKFPIVSSITIGKSYSSAS